MRRTQKNETDKESPLSTENGVDVSIRELVFEVIESHRAALSQQNIAIETDLGNVDASANTSLIRSALGALLQHANAIMTQGGELSVTLIDGQYQWELEVADSVGQFPHSQAEIDSFFSVSELNDTLPTVIPFAESDHLRNAYDAALKHGGQLQTWDCPQGGTAHVIVVPKRRQDLAA